MPVMSTSTCNEFLFVVLYKFAITKNTSNSKLWKICRKYLKTAQLSDSNSLKFFRFFFHFVLSVSDRKSELLKSDGKRFAFTDVTFNTAQTTFYKD